jgi:hypothetical protein
VLQLGCCVATQLGLRLPQPLQLLVLKSLSIIECFIGRAKNQCLLLCISQV